MQNISLEKADGMPSVEGINHLRKVHHKELIPTAGAAPFLPENDFYREYGVAKLTTLNESLTCSQG